MERKTLYFPTYGSKSYSMPGESSSNYRQCLESAKHKNIKLCPEGYCTAKEKFEVYPSAYANGYASQVCKGTKPDADGNYINSYEGKEKDSRSGLSRWFEEKWVNVCKTDRNGDYLPCGRKNFNPDDYPYCRPLNKLEGTIVKTVGELSTDELSQMCIEKQSLPQAIGGKPTRVYLRNTIGSA